MSEKPEITVVFEGEAAKLPEATKRRLIRAAQRDAALVAASKKAPSPVFLTPRNKAERWGDTPAIIADVLRRQHGLPMRRDRFTSLPDAPCHAVASTQAIFADMHEDMVRGLLNAKPSTDPFWIEMVKAADAQLAAQGGSDPRLDELRELIIDELGEDYWRIVGEEG